MNPAPTRVGALLAWDALPAMGAGEGGVPLIHHEESVSALTILLFLHGLVTALLLCVCGLAGSPSLMVVDSTRDHVVWLQDLDSDGRYDGPGESQIFYDDSAVGPNLSVPSALIARQDDLLLLDGGTIDSLISLKDIDGDGFATGPEEVRVIYDDEALGPDLTVPSSMAIDLSGAIYICDRSTTKRHVLRLQDLDGDGDMDESAEAIIWLQIIGNPQLVNFTPTAVCIGVDGSVLVGDGASGFVYSCQDIDGDGVAQGAIEVQPWFTNPSSYGISTVDALVTADNGCFYLADEENGTVLMLHDKDGDGVIDSSDEVQVFIDPTASSSLVVGPMVLFSSPAGGLLIGDPGQDALLLANDFDQDGSASTAGEQQIIFEDQGVLLPSVTGISTVPGPLSITVEAIVPQLIAQSGGTPVQIHGDGWQTGAEVSFRIEGNEFPAVAPLAGIITAVMPALNPGPHDLTLIIEDQEVFVPMAFQATIYFQRGDVDRNAIVGIGDAVTMLMWMFIPGSPVIPCQEAADLNDDGQLQLQDAVHLLSWLFASGPPPASPHPEAGPDPDQQGPGCEQ